MESALVKSEQAIRPDTCRSLFEPTAVASGTILSIIALCNTLRFKTTRFCSRVSPTMLSRSLIMRIASVRACASTGCAFMEAWGLAQEGPQHLLVLKHFAIVHKEQGSI